MEDVRRTELQLKEQHTAVIVSVAQQWQGWKRIKSWLISYTIKRPFAVATTSIQSSEILPSVFVVSCVSLNKSHRASFCQQLCLHRSPPHKPTTSFTFAVEIKASANNNFTAHRRSMAQTGRRLAIIPSPGTKRASERRSLAPLLSSDQEILLIIYTTVYGCCSWRFSMISFAFVTKY